MNESDSLRFEESGIQNSIATDTAGSPRVVRGSLSTWLATNADVICISIVLLMLYVAPFHRALAFPPAEAADLRFLSQVAKVSNPLKYLVGDWGEGPYVSGEYGMYRPIHPISLWLVYKFFGVSAMPNQLINLVLHFTNVLLVLLIVLRIQKDRFLALLFTALFMVSLYTVSPAIWVTDRADLQVGLALLLLIYHVVKSSELNSPLKTWYVLLLSCFALLSKENGLIVPLLALAVAAHKSPTHVDRIRRCAPYALIVCVYFFMRFLMFGSHSVSYHNGGYLFGVFSYAKFDDLPEHLRKFSLVDNFVKNIFAVFVPLFSEMGKWDFGRKTLIGAIATIALVILSSKRLTTLQWYCLGIIVLNAALHFQIFRYRTLYLAQIAFCLFLSASRVLEAGTRRQFAIAMASVLLLVSLVSVDDYIFGNYLWRTSELYDRKLEITMKTYPGRIDPEMAKRVLDYYK